MLLYPDSPEIQNKTSMWQNRELRGIPFLKYSSSPQSLQSIEEQLRQRESELRERQQLHGRERQQQLDDLDLEKFRLRELEEQERINALVEQEVKRRMFERRVRREKEQQLNLERERADHAQELNRIRNEHRREMLKLRQRYETG